MASSVELTEYICEQMRDAGVISYKKMFGEYGIYCNGKFCACVCDDQLFIKITDAGKAFGPDCETAPPYDGAKPSFLITDIENRDFITELIKITCDALPAPKPKIK